MPKPSQSLLEEGFFEFKKSATEGYCWVKGCQKSAKQDRCLCHMHGMRRWRSKKKQSADFCTLRDHAMARGIEFNISPDYWRGIVDAYGFYQRREDEVLSIDRVDPTKGYVEGNIRVITTSLNSSKSSRERYLPEHIQHMLERRRVDLQTENQRYLALDGDADDIGRDEYDNQPDELFDDKCPF